jgi:PAS domain S-box-containing protein
LREIQKNQQRDSPEIAPVPIVETRSSTDRTETGEKRVLPLALHRVSGRVPDPSLAVPKRSLGRRLQYWFITNTFAPSWLPESLQTPLFGYFVAICLQTIAILFTLYLDSMMHVFIFIGSLAVLAIALVALSWGVGPSVFATICGACLLDYVILVPHFTWKLQGPDDIYQILLFALIGLAISIVASQTERARRSAERFADSLTREHARLEAIIATVPDIVSIYDKDGTMIQTNEVGRRRKIFGSEMKSGSLEELVQTHDAFTLVGKAVKLEDLPVTHALRGETVESTEIRFFDREGNERFLSVSAAPLRDVHGNIEGIVSATRDLSALHQSEREAANRAIELEAIFEAMSEGLYIVDRTGRIIRSNAAFKEMMGLGDQSAAAFFALSRDERHTTLEVMDEAGNFLPNELWPESRVLKGEILTGSQAVDMHLHNLEGRLVLLSVTGAPWYDREGELIAALCICRDVTERRKLEQRTHDALDALLVMAEALVSRGEEGIQDEQMRSGALKKIALRMARLSSKVLGCQKVSIFLKERARGIFQPLAIVGFPAVVEEKWWKQVDNPTLDFSAESASPLLAQLQRGEVVLFNMTMQDEPFNTWVHVEQQLPNALIAPMSLDKEFVGLLILGQEDATALYTQADIALAGAVSQLLALVFERERLLDERAESQATELALRTANQRMEEFLGMVSHELKTPLTSIKGNTQLAIRQLKGSMQTFERIIGLYEATEQQSRRLNRLVDDLLDVSRTQAGQLELIPSPCDLREIVSDALREEEKMWPTRTIHLEMDSALALPLLADADRIAQVIWNYLTNALKYSRADCPVFLNVRREGRQVYLAVRDEGPGLSADEQTRIWEQFHRAPGVEILSNLHVSQAGMGLGLYISKMIIEGQQGSVGVQSTLGEGSVFWFYLPLCLAAE